MRGDGWGHRDPLDIFTMYFGFESAAGHGAACSRAGTDLWEVTRYARYDYVGGDGEPRDTTVRLFCRECRTVHLARSEGAMERSTVPARETGFGMPPERVAGLWLHPGRPLLSGHDPDTYYVTRSKDRPESTAEVLGMVGQSRGPRGGTRWGAGAGLNKSGHVERGSGQQWASRTAAVRWVAEQAAAKAAGQ